MRLIGSLSLISLVIVVTASGCPEHCYDCDKAGTCLSCKRGFWGSSCENSCSASCYAEDCERMSGVCKSCKRSYWGSRCENKCANSCYAEDCERENGVCKSCNRSYWGDRCEKKCSQSCYSEDCKREEGICKSCKRSYWGDFCEKRCPQNCYSDDCRREDGICKSCVSGWYGPDCSLKKECAKPKGDDCSFYSKCLDQDHIGSCKDVESIMAAKCEYYHKSVEPYMAENGKAWSSYVRACLQKKLADSVLLPNDKSSQTCATAQRVFFDEHIDCYLNGPVSFCSLSSDDMAKIIKGGRSIIFTSHVWSAFKSAMELRKNCHLNFFWMSLKVIARRRSSPSDTLIVALNGKFPTVSFSAEQIDDDDTGNDMFIVAAKAKMNSTFVPNLDEIQKAANDWIETESIPYQVSFQDVGNSTSFNQSSLPQVQNTPNCKSSDCHEKDYSQVIGWVTGSLFLCLILTIVVIVFVRKRRSIVKTSSQSESMITNLLDDTDHS